MKPPCVYIFISGLGSPSACIILYSVDAWYLPGIYIVNRDILRNKTEIMIIKFACLIYFIILYLITSIYTVCVHNYVTECPAEDLRR